MSISHIQICYQLLQTHLSSHTSTPSLVRRRRRRILLQCTQFCSKDELWEAAKEEEMKIPWKEANEGSPGPEEQYQERFWRRRLDGIGLDTVNKELLAIEFKRTQDARSNLFLFSFE
jgi:hypothetical protein